MKRLLAILLPVLMTFTFFTCSDDESKPADVLVTSHRQTGVFYKLDKSTGEKTEIFTPTINGNTLMELRALVYHPGENLFYVSASSETFENGTQSGYLYSLNPNTKAATVINDNQDDWYAINNWAVAEDDSLIGVGYFRGGGIFGNGSGVAKFGTDGEPGANLVGSPEICCGNGLVYDKSTGIMLVASGNYSDDGEIIIETISAEGVITNSTNITTLTGFPEDQSTTWSVVKAMAKDKKGDIYGIFFNDDLEMTYLVAIDIEGEEITYISTLGADDENQYNSLAFIPAKYAK